MRLQPLLLLALALSFAAAECRAAVLVISNRTGASVPFQLTGGNVAKPSYSVGPGDLVSIPVTGPVGVIFQSGTERREYRLEPNSVFYFGAGAKGQLDLAEIGTRAPGEKPEGDLVSALGPGSAAAKPNDPAKPLVTIPVKILVDEEEYDKPAVWQSRLSRRLQEASTILERFTRVRLQIVAFGTWRSTNGVSDFTQSFREFETSVDPKPARLAIGFTSQYSLPAGKKVMERTNLGGTRQPLHSHILIREWSQHVSEPERLEVLLHELGHQFGAVHSPEQDSVMRPVLGDRQALARSFRITFDPVNTLVISMLGEELRERDLRSFTDLTPGTKRRLIDLYSELQRSLPQDPAAGNFLKILGAPSR